MSKPDTAARLTAAELCARLIRFDTSNYGEGRSAGESDLATWIHAALERAGYEPHIVGPSPARASVVLRVPGTDATLPALLVHAHTDVVPVEPSQWTVPAFAGRISDGYVWGRGATDMKDMVAMTLATLLEWARAGTRPRRDIVVLFVADEESGGEHGALWLVRNRPELFAGVSFAIGESGGDATELAAADGTPVRCYPIATGERGTLHLRLRARGTAGHASRPHPGHALERLIAACHRINTYAWPLRLTETVRSYIETIDRALGNDPDLESEAGVLAAIDRLGPAGDVAAATIRCTATTTVVNAGMTVNVIPGSAEALVDVRCLPGTEEEAVETLRELIGPDLDWEFVDRQSPVSAPADSPWFDAMRDAILAHDPEAVVPPVCMGGGTDAKAFAQLGIAGYGFAPLTADPGGRRPAGAHGADERMPVASINGGQRILEEFLRHV
ncbi:M20/M25/M40 family metallo-hydrolase [Leucobacter chromiireducens]|uniref:M20/M25/M40 family metallo-hydrolase n=1 Tax=Leucobacter chromiireducens subsp. chromiireducens TaxID=660067 RepID=A0ABS1SSD6_9MICO|nr:M20/M25/M40 family metallo-hydrolase [Leucobacter chromiireducens]MBL3689841.1 M20/M25/M40 family metallo-hydrolase [Leucobacter chromiireducens subsp. chromiireducens]